MTAIAGVIFPKQAQGSLIEKDGKVSGLDRKALSKSLGDFWKNSVDSVDTLGLFDAIHKTKALNPPALSKDQKPLFDWVATQGVNRQKFEDVYKSFGVASKSQRTIDITSAYDITGTPALAIDGKYIIGPGMAPSKADNSVNYELFFKRVDQLIEMARKSRGGK